MADSLENQFNRYLEEMNFELPAHTQQRMLDFLEFLVVWNRQYNLTAVRAREDMLTHHLLDSLSVAPHLKGQSILDVGSGAGFPGIPLAMLFSEKTFTLLDSNGKKARFLLQAKAEFSMENVQVVQERVENFHTMTRFDAIICRAVGGIAELIELTDHLCHESTERLFMKGAYPEDELRDIPESSVQVVSLQVPGLDKERHLVVIKE